MPPGKVMSIDSVKINPSLVMMRECDGVGDDENFLIGNFSENEMA